MDEVAAILSTDPIDLELYDTSESFVSYSVSSILRDAEDILEIGSCLTFRLVSSYDFLMSSAESESVSLLVSDVLQAD